VLRQSFEGREVTIRRALRSTTFATEFMLVERIRRVP
jgi:hypothetical protein